MVSLELSGCSSSRSMASSFSISCPSTIASPAQSYHRRASFTNSFPTIQCRISDQRCVSSAAPLPKDQSLPITPVPLPVLHGLDTGTDTRLCIFSGTANPALSQEIAYYLGLSLGKIKITWCDVELLESVEGCNVFLVQPTCRPVDENLMELNFMIDACRKAYAKDITVVIPYFGYSRADKPNQGRESITARLVSKLIARARADRVVACDLHSEHLLGFFDISINNIYAQPVILDYLVSKSLFPNDLVVVSPDVGGVKRARAFAKKMSNAPLAIIEKSRSAHNVAEVIAYHLGIGVGKIGMKMFYDEESDVQLPENVEGCNVFLVRPTCPPVDENLMELCTMIDACRQGSAKEITVVIPYFGYARADQKTKYFESVAGELVSKLITRAGPDSILVCDIHSEHLMRYVDIPVENVYCQRVILDYLGSTSLCSNDLVVVFPDVGGVKRAQIFAKELSDAPLVVVDHSRRNHNVAKEIAYHLGIGVGNIGMKMFYDEESDVQLPENVEGCNVFLVRPTCPPVYENLMELCTMIDACRQGSAKEITAVIPYFGYARADQKTKYFESVAGELVSKLITRAGPDSILVCDIHSEHLMRYVDIPVENVYCQRVILDYLGSTSLCSNDLVVVFPDVGGVKRAQIFAKELSDAPLVVVDHSRRNHNVAKTQWLKVLNYCTKRAQERSMLAARMLF